MGAPGAEFWSGWQPAVSPQLERDSAGSSLLPPEARASACWDSRWDVLKVTTCLLSSSNLPLEFPPQPQRNRSSFLQAGGSVWRTWNFLWILVPGTLFDFSSSANSSPKRVPFHVEKETYGWKIQFHLLIFGILSFARVWGKDLEQHGKTQMYGRVYIVAMTHCLLVCVNGLCSFPRGLSHRIPI